MSISLQSALVAIILGFTLVFGDNYSLSYCGYTDFKCESIQSNCEHNSLTCCFALRVSQAPKWFWVFLNGSEVHTNHDDATYVGIASSFEVGKTGDVIPQI